MTDMVGRICEECHQPVSSARVHRFSEQVAMLGRVLWIVGLLLVFGGPAFGCAMMRTGGPALADSVRDAKREAVEGLQRISGLPREVVDRFESTNLFPSDARERLTDAQREQVDEVLGDFLAAGAGAALRGTAAVGLVSLATIAAILFGAPAVIAGLLMASRKTVWTCDACHRVQSATAG